MPTLVTRPFNALGFQMLEDYPPFMQDDPHIQAIVHAWSRELQLATDRIDWLARQWFPQTADTYGLAIFEAELGLTINPPGLSVEDRRALVRANILKAHGDASGASWNASVTAFVGPGYEVTEYNPFDPTAQPSEYQIVVKLPYPSNSPNFIAARDLIRVITPAHIQVIFTSFTGLTLDSGALDIDTLS